MTYMYTCIAQPRRGSIIWCYDWWSAHGYRPLFTAILNWKLVHHPIEDVFTMIKYPCVWSEESLKKEVATKHKEITNDKKAVRIVTLTLIHLLIEVLSHPNPIPDSNGQWRDDSEPKIDIVQFVRLCYQK